MWYSSDSNEYKVINDYLYTNDEYNELPCHVTLIYLYKIKWIETDCVLEERTLLKISERKNSSKTETSLCQI